ncbi:MAG: hypothetical protein ACRC1K_08010 [Planctomycetia bacterium]
MQPSWIRRCLAVVAAGASLAPATADEPRLVPQPVLPTTIVTESAPIVTENAGHFLYAPAPIPGAPLTTEVVGEGAVVTSEYGAGLPVFYRRRPNYFHHGKAAAVVHANRLQEPDWYRQYRCDHFGYYPTQWAPWPQGWLDARRPAPGPHPYDVQQVIPEKVLLQEQKMLEDGGLYDDKASKPKAPPLSPVPSR